MKYFTIHQTTFLPYIGYWAKVNISEINLMETADIFSTTSMYYRTWYSKGLEYEYLTLPIDRTVVPLYDVKLKTPGIIKDKIRSALFSKDNGLPYYKKIKDSLLIECNKIQYCETMHDVNFLLYNWVVDMLEIDTRCIIIKPGDVVYLEDESKTAKLIRKINQYKCNDMTYISGGSGRNYLDSDLMKDAGIDYVFQTVQDDFYKGSIIHYLMKYTPKEIKNIMNITFSYTL